MFEKYDIAVRDINIKTVVTNATITIPYWLEYSIHMYDTSTDSESVNKNSAIRFHGYLFPIVCIQHTIGSDTDIEHTIETGELTSSPSCSEFMELYTNIDVSSNCKLNRLYTFLTNPLLTSGGYSVSNNTGENDSISVSFIY